MAVNTAAQRQGQPSLLATAAGVLGSLLFSSILGILVLGLLVTQALGYRITTVQSGSMEPALSRGDIIVTKPASSSSVKVGEIILFEVGEDLKFLAAHRAIGFVNLVVNVTDSETGEQYTQTVRQIRTKGDANVTQDSGFVTPERLRGKVFLTIPEIGFLFKEFRLQQLLLLIAGITALGWGFYETKAWMRRRKVGLRA
jgi:signal peptidase I